MAWRWQRLLARPRDPRAALLARARVLRRVHGGTGAADGGRRRRGSHLRDRAPPSEGQGGPVAGSVLLERALGGAATLTLAAVGFVLAVGHYPSAPTSGSRASSCSATIVLAVALFSRRARPLLARTVPLLRKVRLERPIRAAYEGMHSYRDHPGLLAGVFALTLAVQAVRVLAIWLAGQGGRRRPLAAAVLRDGAAALPRAARAVLDQRDRRARVVLRQLPRQARRRRGQGLRDRLPLLRGHAGAGRCPARCCSAGRACAASGPRTMPRSSHRADVSLASPEDRVEHAVSVVVVTYNGLPWVERCLESVRGHETIVVDHGSTDGTARARARAVPRGAPDRAGEQGPRRRLERGDAGRVRRLLPAAELGRLGGRRRGRAARGVRRGASGGGGRRAAAAQPGRLAAAARCAASRPSGGSRPSTSSCASSRPARAR